MYNWKTINWNNKMGRGGYVHPLVNKLPLWLKTWLCTTFGHPLAAVEPMSWRIGGNTYAGHMCRRCFRQVHIDRLISSHGSSKGVDTSQA